MVNGALQQLMEGEARERDEKARENDVRREFGSRAKESQRRYAEQTAWAKPVEDMNQAEYTKWRNSGLSLEEWAKQKK